MDKEGVVNKEVKAGSPNNLTLELGGPPLDMIQRNNREAQHRLVENEFGEVPEAYKNISFTQQENMLAALVHGVPEDFPAIPTAQKATPWPAAEIAPKAAEVISKARELTEGFIGHTSVHSATGAYLTGRATRFLKDMSGTDRNRAIPFLTFVEDA